MKDNFLAGRAFTDITRLNEEALAWCAAQAACYNRRAVDYVPSEEHDSACLSAAAPLDRRFNSGRPGTSGPTSSPATWPSS